MLTLQLLKVGEEEINPELTDLDCFFVATLKIALAFTYSRYKSQKGLNAFQGILGILTLHDTTLPQHI